jgi:hypothetical protein
MSLFCDSGYDHDGADWWWYQPSDEAPLATKRSRKCCSCGEKVGVGDTARKVQRFRPTSERCNYIEESIYGDEVPLADWYLCETCGDLADSLSELGFCYHLGDGESLKQQIADYRRDEGTALTHNVRSQATDAALSRQVACTDGLCGNGNYGEQKDGR